MRERKLLQRGRRAAVEIQVHLEAAARVHLLANRTERGSSRVESICVEYTRCVHFANSAVNRAERAAMRTDSDALERERDALCSVQFAEGCARGSCW